MSEAPQIAPMIIDMKLETPAIWVDITPPPSNITMATPRLAPESIPNMEGPANGLLNEVCSSRPEQARAAPHRVAVTACGKRESKIMNRQLSRSGVPPNRI